jgi:hypothetical protein
MSQWTFWEWLAYAGLWIAGIIEAAEAALLKAREIRRRLPLFLRSRNWAFAPLALISASTVILILMQFGLLPAREPQPVITTDDFLLEYKFDSPAFLMTINEKPFLPYKLTNRLALAVRIGFADIDRMTDNTIQISTAYTITGDQQALVVKATDEFVKRFNPYRQNLVELDLFMLPVKFSPSDIKSLSDIERLGGKILTIKSIGPFGPFLQPPTQPPQPQAK